MVELFGTGATAVSRNKLSFSNVSEAVDPRLMLERWAYEPDIDKPSKATWADSLEDPASEFMVPS